jgi:peroxiredoxin
MTRPLVLAAALLSLAIPAVADEAAPEAARPQVRAEAKPEITPIALDSVAPMTDVKMTSVDGKSVSIADAKGTRGTVVMFTCNHCPYVKAWQTRMVRIGNKSREKGVGAIAINSNSPTIVPGDNLEGMKELATGKGYKFPYVVDEGSKVARAFGASRTPEVFLLDSGGKVVYHGAIDDNSEDAEKVTERYLQDAIDALVAGTPIEVRETKSIGCGIKFAPQS